MKTASITLRRTGTFNVNYGANDATQCGRYRGQRLLSYTVEINANGGCLDENGFLIDNNEVQKYFDEKYLNVREFQSCEKIALAALSDLRKIVGRSRCQSVRVTIAPGDHAGITAESNFKRGEH